MNALPWIVYSRYYFGAKNDEKWVRWIGAFTVGFINKLKSNPPAVALWIFVGHKNLSIDILWVDMACDIRLVELYQSDAWWLINRHWGETASVIKLTNYAWTSVCLMCTCLAWALNFVVPEDCIAMWTIRWPF